MSNQTISIQRKLLKLVFSAVLPLFTFAVALVAYIVVQQSTALETSLRSTTRALASSIELEISSIESNLQMLASLEDFDAERMPDLHRRLRRFVESRKGDWSSISLVSLDGQVIMNTRAEYGPTKINHHDDAFFNEILRTEMPTISGFRMGKLLNVPVFTVAVPVKVGGRLSLILAGTMTLDILSKKLKSQKLPATWNCAVIDNDGIILARSRQQHKYVGTSAVPKVVKRISEVFEDSLQVTNRDGLERFVSFKKSPHTKWSVVIGIPVSETHIPSFKMLWLFLGGGMILVLIGIFNALSISKRITSSVISLARSAEKLGKRQELGKVESIIKEIKEVESALVNASIEREEYDKMMKDLYVQAQEAIEIRDGFLSVASHELKTPLTTLNLQAEILKRSVKDDFTPERVENAVSRMLNQLKRLTNLIDDLLDITRINAGKLDVRLEELDFVSLVKEIVKNFEIETRGIHISFEGCENLKGQFDRNRLEQIFTNLVSNAIKYGDGKPIEVRVFKEDTHAVFVIKDHGIGIEEKDLTKIFERFERVVHNNNIRGLGLGLWIVKRIVEHLDGSIHVESPGLKLGTTFTVKIPTNS